MELQYHHHQLQQHPHQQQHHVDVRDVSEVPMSRTHQYRKVMKPLLERKRRARINKCLDELKDLMVYALQSEGESIAKLEKADVLELTVKHLQKLKRQRMLQANPALDADRYGAGFAACAAEVSRCLASVPGVDVALGTTLMSHLGSKVQALREQSARISAPLSVSVPTTTTTSAAAASGPQSPLVQTAPAAPPAPAAPAAPAAPPSDCGYSSGRESVSPSGSDSHPLNYVKQEVEERRKRRESSSSSSSSSSSVAGVWRPF